MNGTGTESILISATVIDTMGITIATTVEEAETTNTIDHTINGVITIVVVIDTTILDDDPRIDQSPLQRALVSRQIS